MPAGSSSPAARAIDKALAVVGLPNDLAVLLLVVVAGLLVKASFATAAMYYVGSQLAEVAARLRLDLIDRVLNARWSCYIRQPVGRFANAISGEVARAAEAYISVATLISLLIQVTIYTVLSVLVDWRLTAMSLTTGGSSRSPSTS